MAIITVRRVTACFHQSSCNILVQYGIIDTSAASLPNFMCITNVPIMRVLLHGCPVTCRSDNLNMYEELYFNITSNSTGVAYNLTRPPIPWNYTQCAIADSQFFWAGNNIAVLSIFRVEPILQPQSRHQPNFPDCTFGTACQDACA